jgi:hypothetical protein
MTNILQKPYTSFDYAEFAMRANEANKRIEITDSAAYMLAENEALKDNKIVLNSDWCRISAARAEKKFKAEFIETSLGWYRKVPRGFSNAPQSWDIIDKLAADGISEAEAQSIVFYTVPDFTDPQQCTDEWINAHAFHPAAMSAQQWREFHLDALIRWVNDMYADEVAKII